MAESKQDNSNASVESLRNENKPLGLKVMKMVHEGGQEAYLRLSPNDRLVVDSLYQQLVDAMNRENHPDEYYLQFENEIYLGDVINQFINCNTATLNKRDNVSDCCYAFANLINQLLCRQVELIRQKEEAQRRVQEQQEEKKSQNEQVKDLVPPAVKIALSCVHDDVATMAAHYLKPYIKCVDVKHSIIYSWDTKKLLWERGTLETLVNIVMYIVRPAVHNVRLNVARFIANCEDETIKETLEIENRRSLVLYNKLGTVGFCSDIAKLLKVRLQDLTFLEKLDSNPDILAVKNGQVVNLKTGISRARVQEDYCSFECPVAYTPGISSEVVDRFLNDITLNRNDLKEYLQFTLGYCITGKTNLQQLYIWYGPDGANGKTTLVELMRTVLGPFYVQAHKEVFLKVDGARAGNASPYLAELRGKRMAVFCETEIDDKLNEAQIKALTGGDRIKARAMYQSEIEFSNIAKAIICSNYKPNSHTNNLAWWRRVIMIPFNCRFVEAPSLPHERLKDPSFKDKLLNNSEAMSAYFTWLIEGAIKTYTSNPVLPKCVSETTNEYQMEQDIYSKFVADTLDLSDDPNSSWFVPAKDLYAAFVEWMREEGIKAISNKVFGENIKKVLTSGRKSSGNIYLNCRFKQADMNDNNSLPIYPISISDLVAKPG